MRAWAPFAWALGHEFPRCPIQLPFGYDAVQQPDALGLHRGQGLAGEHQFQRRRSTQQTHTADRSTEPGVDAQPHFRKPQIALVALHGDPVVAGQCKLHAAAQRKTVNGSNGRAGQTLQSVQKPLPLTHQLPGLAGFGEGAKLRNIGSCDEPGILGRLDHHACGRICGQFFNEARQFPKDGLGKHVGPAVRLVKNQPADSVGIVLGTPMLGHVSEPCDSHERYYRNELGARPNTRRNARLKPAADSYPACAATSFTGTLVRRNSRRALSIRQYRM